MISKELEQEFRENDLSYVFEWGYLTIINLNKRSVIIRTHTIEYVTSTFSLKQAELIIKLAKEWHKESS